MPNMSHISSLKQRFEETCMLPKKRAVTPPRNNIVKRIVEAFEMKYGNRRAKTVSSLNARLIDMACQNNAQQESFDPQCESFSSPVKIVRTSKKTEDTLNGFVNNQEMDNVKKLTKVLVESVNSNIDSNDTEKDNYLNNIKKISNMSLNPSNVRDKIAESGSIEPNPGSSTSVSNRIERKSSIAWRHIFSNVNQDSKFKTQKRVWPNKPKKDAFWDIKRQGQLFSNPPVNNEFLRKCEKTKSACLNTLLNSSMKDNSPDKEDYDEILMIIDTLDESGNSYKNLQVDMFDDFDSEEERVEVSKAEDNSRFVEISLKSPDNAQNNESELQSNLSDESMEYFDRLNETYLTFKDKTDNQESVENGVQNVETRLFTIDKKKSARYANSSAEPRANAEEKGTKWIPTLCNKLPPIKLLKKLLLVSNKSTQHIMKKKVKHFNKMKEHLQRAQPQQRPLQISPDSGYGTMYDDLHFSSIPSMSKSTPTLDTCYNISPTFKTFYTEDTRRDSHSHGIKKWDGSLKLDEVLNEKIATDYGLTRSTPNMTIAEPRQKIPLARVSKYEFQTSPEHSFVSVTRINKMVEQSEIREPLWCSDAVSDVFAAPAASTPRRKNDRSWRHWYESAPTLNKIGERENPFHDYYKQITRDKPRSNISYDIEQVTANSNICPLSGTCSCAQSDSCFATVRPRNFGGKSFGIKRNNDDIFVIST